jgi:hypothetical protein
MDENYVECPEMSGKTIQTLRITKTPAMELRFNST